MADYNIKISELNPFAASVRTEDFFPLVDSSSMTTFRATVQHIGLLMTHSIFADTASYAQGSGIVGAVQYAISSSWASASISASYAFSASHAILADSTSYYPSQQFQPSTLYASRSHDAGYATRSIDVDTYGTIYNFPIWYSGAPGGGNGDLSQTSPMVMASPDFSGTYKQGPVAIDNSDTFHIVNPASASYVPYPWFPNYTITRYNPDANRVDVTDIPGGLVSYHPIISQTFVGTDQRFWLYGTASNSGLFTTNQYFSGSAGGVLSGSFYTIPVGAGGISSSFNGKWVRLVSRDNYSSDPNMPSYSACSKNPGYGEMYIPTSYMGGLVKLYASTPNQVDPVGGVMSNIVSVIYAHVFVGVFESAPQITIHSVNNYEGQLIRSIRLGRGYGNDPQFYLDVFIDGTVAGDNNLHLECQSWGNFRFLSTPNWGPWPSIDSGSNDPHQTSYIVAPVAPGHYSAVSPKKKLNYYIQGLPVVINPTYNEMTQSGLVHDELASTHSLHVSGNINTNMSYYCNNNPGLTTKVTYGTTNLYFSGGILIRKTP